MLTKEILCAHAPHGVKVTNGKETVEVDINNIGDTWIACKNGEFKLILRPLSSLTKPITHNGETVVFTELFEIGDDGGFIYDFGNGNTKLIKDLENIAKYNCYHDINYLPYTVVKLMYEYHFDVHGLLSDGHAIELKEVDKNGK